MQRVFDIASLNVTVIGAARSGLAAARLLKAEGGKVFLTELAGEEKYPDAAALLTEAGIAYEFGGHSDRVFLSDLMIVSPGVPSESPILLEAEKRGIPVLSEIEVGTMFVDAPLIAVTGTNGKTTTTTLIGEIMSAAGRSPIVAGNIGLAYSDAILQKGGEAGAVVLEISSFQLDHCVSFRPATAVITTITPDHLYRYHGDFREYIAAKQRIFMNHTEDDALIYNVDDVVVDGAVKSARSRLFPVSVTQRLKFGGWLQGGELVIDIGQGREVVAVGEQLLVHGRHNYMNVLMSAIAARLNGVTMDVIALAAASFKGVEHRLEFVCDVDGVDWVNDSKATNVDSVVIALQSFRKPVVLIAGGRGKGTSYDPMKDLLREKVLSMILIGESAEEMEEEFTGLTTIVRARDMLEAVNIARAAARSGDAVLLSPACASFDMYESFEHRGRDFKERIANVCKIQLMQHPER